MLSVLKINVLRLSATGLYKYETFSDIISTPVRAFPVPRHFYFNNILYPYGSIGRAPYDNLIWYRSYV